MKWTLVTGGAKHLGSVICKRLAQDGLSVVVHYKTSEKEAQQVVQECLHLGVDAECIQGDFSSFTSTQQFISDYQKRFPDTLNLINIVGNYLLGSSLETSVEQWIDLLHTNFQAPYQLIRSCLPTLKKNQGSIINLGVTGLNSFRADTYDTAYAITKSSLLMLTKSLAVELAPFQVRVNMVSPGYLEEAIDLPEDLSLLPMNRPATRIEVADAIAFIISDKAKYITGQNLEVGGGLRL